MHTARGFTSLIKPLDRFTANAQNLRVVVDFETAHAVVNTRPETDNLEGTFNVGFRIIKELAAEVWVLLGLYVFIERVVRLFKLVVRDLVEVSHVFERGELTHDVRLHGVVKELLGHVATNDFAHDVGFTRID